MAQQAQATSQTPLPKKGYPEQLSARGATKAKAAEDAQSIITVDKLKKFNEVHGSIAGNQTE